MDEHHQQQQQQERQQSPKPPFSDAASPIPLDTCNDVVLSEAQKIIQMGLQKDYALSEKDKIIQDAAEVIENIRKNLVRIQLEYETLDQKFSKEVSYRAELVKRTETTREMIDAASHYSNILATSIKDMESDKSEIKKLCDLIYRRQEEINDGRKRMEALLEEQEELINNKVVELTARNEEMRREVSMLNDELSQHEARLKSETVKNANLEEGCKDLREELNRTKTNLMTEASERARCQNAESQLKNFARRKVRNARKLNDRCSSYRKRIKYLKSKIVDVQNRFEGSQKSYSDLAALHESLMSKNRDEERENLKVREGYVKELEDLRGLLEVRLTEKEELKHRFDQLEKDLEEERRKVRTMGESCKSAESDYTLRLSKLEERERDVKMATDENLHLKEEMNEMTKDLREKRREIESLESAVRVLKSDATAKKCNVLQRELLQCREDNAKLQEQCDRLREIAEKERSDKIQISFDTEARVNQLKNELKNLEERSRGTEFELNNVKNEWNRARNDAKIKSLALEKLGYKVHVRMKAEARMEEARTALKFKEEKSKTEKLIERIREMEMERAHLERNFEDMLAREKSRNEALQFEKGASERTVANLGQELQEARALLEAEAKKRNEAEGEVREMRKLSEKCAAHEGTIADLTKSLKSAEAGIEAYKFIVKKLETEAVEMKKKKKKSDEDVKKTFRSDEFDVFGSAANERCDRDAESSKENDEKAIESERKGKDFSDAGSEISATSRKLFTTPRRMVQNSFFAKRFGAATPSVDRSNAKANRDPYDFDSDSSVERSDFDRISNEGKSKSKKGSAAKQRRII